MGHTNINIQSPYGNMPYYIDYYHQNNHVTNGDCIYETQDNIIRFYYDGVTATKNGNEWLLYNALDYHLGIIFDRTKFPGVFTDYLKTIDNGNNIVASYIPNHRKMSNVKIYFPQFSVDTYVRGVKYALTAVTYVNGVEIQLGSWILNRNDCLAANDTTIFSNEKFYEYININMLDPWSIIYDDDWKDFRVNVCHEPINKDNTQLNNTGSVVKFLLYPVTDVVDGVYTFLDDYHGGQSSINISNNEHDYLQFNIRDNRYDNDGMCYSIFTNVSYNNAYTKDLAGFKEYIKETYLVDEELKMKFEFVIQDNDNIYSFCEVDIDDPTMTISVDQWLFDCPNPLIFDNWDGYHEGMFINCTLKLYKNNSEEYFAYLPSNHINLTPEIFRYLIFNKNGERYINLDQLDMNIYNIRAVNKIQQNIIKMDRPDDYKANIIKPAFFKSYDLGSIVIHPDVTENICVNLDMYKSKVDTFVMKINGVSFIEYARTNAGVIFHIEGSLLSGIDGTGVYYILNSSGEVVTSGKYMVER